MSQGISTVSVSLPTRQRVVSIGEQLRQRGWTLSCAESCTGGGLAFALTSVEGSSDWFNQSWVTYSNSSKEQAVGVPESVLSEFGAVSQQTVETMVHGVAKQSGAQLAVSISGIAGPGGGTADKPVGTVWFGFWLNGEVECGKKWFRGDRQQVRSQAVDYAISFLHQWLVEHR
ncbi:CinA family protein [Alteromonas aestuariivivens]|uniref:CinA family protein n=1 Tax=Alteromonas aestuariivivens TaxID=1938339 RepID=A0A3D8M478_9ALTE|nr:CinA family protein [Alteromonas aestuariivivens]RDV24355.1 CinA family protein [Alteromonas aestuariivivens]